MFFHCHPMKMASNIEAEPMKEIKHTAKPNVKILVPSPA